MSVQRSFERRVRVFALGSSERAHEEEARLIGPMRVAPAPKGLYLHRRLVGLETPKAANGWGGDGGARVECEVRHSVKRPVAGVRCVQAAVSGGWDQVIAGGVTHALPPASDELALRSAAGQRRRARPAPGGQRYGRGRRAAGTWGDCSGKSRRGPRPLRWLRPRMNPTASSAVCRCVPRRAVGGAKVGWLVGWGISRFCISSRNGLLGGVCRA